MFPANVTHDSNGLPTGQSEKGDFQRAVKCVTDMEDLLPARQANISQHLAVLRYSRLVDYAQDGALRCYYLSRPELVRALLQLVRRGEATVKRTAEQIKSEKASKEQVDAKPDPARAKRKRNRKANVRL